VSDPEAEPGYIGTEDTGEEPEEKPRVWPWVSTVLDGLSGTGSLLTIAALALVPTCLAVVRLRRCAS
jgi:hypothetical protein